MSNLICKKDFNPCRTPGMCAPHGGCQAAKSEWQAGYDEGRRMGTKHMYAEVDRLKVENEALRKYGEEFAVLAERRREEVEALRKALVTIRDESSDLGACECAADALTDSHKESGHE